MNLESKMSTTVCMRRPSCDVHNILFVSIITGEFTILILITTFGILI